MKRILLLAAFLVAAAVPSFAQKGAAAAKADPTKGVREAFDRLIDGIKQVDADKVLSGYEKSDRLLIFNNNGSATGGWENVKANITASYPNITNVNLEVTGVRVEMLGRSAAYVTCKWKQTQENNGKLESAAGRMTLVYRLFGKEWKIVHRHTSPNVPAANQPVFPSEREGQ